MNKHETKYVTIKLFDEDYERLERLSNNCGFLGVEEYVEMVLLEDLSKSE